MYLDTVCLAELSGILNNCHGNVVNGLSLQEKCKVIATTVLCSFYMDMYAFVFQS